MEHILVGVGGTAVLGVEVEAAGEAAVLQHLIHAHGGLVDAPGELVGVPSQEGVALVGVDGAQHAVDGGDAEIVLEGVARQGGVVGLDVHLEVLVQTILPQEADGGGGVEVVLVLHGLLGLGLDVEVAGEAD